MRNFALLLLVLLLSLAVLVSCGDKSPSEDTPDDKECVHEYADQPIEAMIKDTATCLSPAVYYKSCKLCGAKGTETFTYGEHSDHLYVDKVDVDYLVSYATCAAPDTFYKSCAFCGIAGEETFTDGETREHTKAAVANAETFAEYKNCDHGHLYYFSCSKCGALLESTFESGNRRSHEDDNGDYMCDYEDCGKPMKNDWDDPSVENMTDKHEFGKN